MTLKMHRTGLPMSEPALATNSAAHRRTRGTNWQAIRERILSRDAGLCQPCKRLDLLTPATEVDHITPLEQGGTDAPANLQSICAECHRAKSAQERQSGWMRPGAFRAG